MSNDWQLDMQHSSISFSVRHLLVSKVRGRFARWTGTLSFDERDPRAASVEVQIDTSSVDTGEPARDTHLRSADFLDAANHPFMRFRSSSLELAGDATYKVHGELTIRGTTRPVTLTVEHGGAMRDPWGNERAGFTARATINRKEFGVNFNQVLDHGGLALGEQVAIEIDVEAVRMAQVLRAAR
jgi:polyisoprenoid-binding protein YceI